jgi:hypothetical protein
VTAKSTIVKTKRALFGLSTIVGWLALAGAAKAQSEQFIIFNLSGGAKAEAFRQITQQFNSAPAAKVRVGVGAIFSYFGRSRARIVEDLEQFLQLAMENDTPIVVQLDGENWWGERPDLWNWWDPARPGYSPSNRDNVEWTDWSAEHAIKIAWRNWGRQIRVLPPPNLMSERYREACRAEMAVLIPVVLNWSHRLPPEKRHLFVGIKVGWESSIGVNAWHYPDGNALFDRPVAEDPVKGLEPDALPHRGVAQIGYAAVRTAGIRTGGELAEADLAEIVRRHLDELCRQAADLGVPRDRLFTHSGGWKEGELLYQAAVNRHSSPGWSFYKHATDPRKDSGVQAALRSRDAPHWAAVEWLFQGPRQTEPWRRALQATLSNPRCRYLCLYNWEGVRDSKEVLEAVRQLVAGSVALQDENSETINERRN